MKKTPRDLTILERKLKRVESEARLIVEHRSFVIKKSQLDSLLRGVIQDWEYLKGEMAHKKRELAEMQAEVYKRLRERENLNKEKINAFHEKFEEVRKMVYDLKFRLSELEFKVDTIINSPIDYSKAYELVRKYEDDTDLFERERVSKKEVKRLKKETMSLAEKIKMGGKKLVKKIEEEEDKQQKKILKETSGNN
jgi:hypothetical protein